MCEEKFNYCYGGSFNLCPFMPVAFALTDTQKDELFNLYRQQHELRLQIVEKQQEAGLISDEAAGELKERFTENWQYHQERMNQGDYGYCPGLGYGGRGRFRGRRGAYGNCPYKYDAAQRWESRGALEKF